MTHADDAGLTPTPEPSQLTVALRTARIPATDLAVFAPLGSHTPPPWAPHRIGSYDIRREVGRGGVGIVYEAYDPRLRRAVAVKVLKDARPSDADLLRRFRTEAEAVAQLQHPHIVQVIEVGSSDGRPFVALEYLAGGSLFQKIGARPQPPAGAAELVRTLAKATAHAHDHGVLHRDLKPGNILFTSEGTPKITDFGSARFFDPGQAPDSNDPGLTRAGEVIGTPQYMAPEQARGTPDAVGPAADVYALGAILYELLTGRPPHTGVDAFDVIHAVRTRDPIPPRNLQPRVPRDLNTICLTCLEKDPNRRYASAHALADDLGRFAVGDPIMARPAGPVRTVWVAARRHPAMAGLIAGLVLAGVIGLTAFGAQFRATVVARDAAEAKTAEVYAAHEATRRGKDEAERNLAKAGWELYRGQVNRAQLLLEKANTQEAAALLEKVEENDRGWEWAFLRDRVESSVWDYSFPRSAPALGASWPLLVELSPDGTRLAVSTANPYEPGTGRPVIYENPSSITVFRVTDGSVVCQIPDALPGHTKHLVWADGTTVAAADHRGRIRAWNVGTLGLVADLAPITDRDDPDRSFGLVVSPDGWVLRTAPGGRFETFHVLRPGDRSDHPGQAFFPQDLARGGRLAMVQKFVAEGFHAQRLLAFGPVQVLSETHGVLNHPTFGPNGAGVLVATFDPNHLRLTNRNAGTGTVRWERRLPVRDYGGCRFSPDGRLVVVVRPGLGEVHTFDASTGEALGVSRGFVGDINDLAFSPCGLWLATVGDDGSTRVWDVASGALAVHFRSHRGSVRRVTFSANGRYLITAGADERIVCRDLARTRADNGLMPPHETGGKGTRMGAIGFTPAGALRVLNTESGGTTDFDTATGNPIERRRYDGLALRDAKELRDFVFTPDASRLAGRIGSGSDVGVWDSANGARIRTFPADLTRLYAVALSPDASRVVVTGFRRPDPKGPIECRLQIWDVPGDRLVADVKTDVPVLGVGFSPDGSRFAAGYLRPTSRPGPYADLFDRNGVPTGVSVPPLPTDADSPHRVYANVVKFSPDGRTLVGTCWGTSQLLVADAETGAHIRAIPQIHAITDVAFSPDGQRLVTTGYSDVLTLYDVPSWDEITTFVCVRGRKDDWAFPGLTAFSPDGRSLAVTHWDGTFTLWHVPADGETAGRKVSEASAFRYHVHSARDAIAKNLPLAYEFHARMLAALIPPTEALCQDWAALRAEVAPTRIFPALGGGLAGVGEP